LRSLPEGGVWQTCGDAILGRSGEGLVMLGSCDKEMVSSPEERAPDPAVRSAGREGPGRDIPQREEFGKLAESGFVCGRKGEGAVLIGSCDKETVSSPEGGRFGSLEASSCGRSFFRRGTWCMVTTMLPVTGRRPVPGRGRTADPIRSPVCEEVRGVLIRSPCHGGY
jgi:hypothetical protein